MRDHITGRNLRHVAAASGFGMTIFLGKSLSAFSPRTLETS